MRCRSRCPNSNFNPLPHTRENSALRTYPQAIPPFQSTPSYEGEQRKNFDRSDKKYFNPLPHTRENRCFAFWVRRENQFQSTPSYEGERHTAGSKSRPCKFQSTPSYEGERVTRAETSVEQGISIHSLIRGRTFTDGL